MGDGRRWEGRLLGNQWRFRRVHEQALKALAAVFEIIANLKALVRIVVDDANLYWTNAGDGREDDFEVSRCEDVAPLALRGLERSLAV